MDVVLNLESGDIYFIEVKCHEIFDNHKYIKLKLKYKDTEFINSFLGSNTSSKKEMKEEYLSMNEEFLTAKDFGCNLDSFHFDFKQFLCHLMGILSYKKNNKGKIYFYYLFYRNEEYEKNENSNIYQELERELNTIFDVFTRKYPDINFGYFYNNKFDSLKNIDNKYTSSNLN